MPRQTSLASLWGIGAKRQAAEAPESGLSEHNNKRRSRGSDQSAFVACPVCNRQVPVLTADEHVDQCLTSAGGMIAQSPEPSQPAQLPTQESPAVAATAAVVAGTTTAPGATAADDSTGPKLAEKRPGSPGGVAVAGSGRYCAATLGLMTSATDHPPPVPAARPAAAATAAATATAAAATTTNAFSAMMKAARTRSEKQCFILRCGGDGTESSPWSLDWDWAMPSCTPSGVGQSSEPPQDSIWQAVVKHKDKQTGVETSIKLVATALQQGQRDGITPSQQRQSANVMQLGVPLSRPNYHQHHTIF